MTTPKANSPNLDRSTQRHPTPEQLRAFGLGQLRAGEAALVEQHVENCDACCRVLSEVPDDTVLAKFKNCDTVTGQGESKETPIESETAQGQIPLALQEHPRYRILKQLGRGGMGVVYKAEHRLMERPVALKVISRRLIANRSAVERFQREVKLAARLTHPNIVVAHDAEQAGDLHFLVMEFVDGISLAQFVELRGPLPASAASLLIRQAALGLQAAAQRGMVHRDIKPQNLMLTRTKQVKILDFGLARFASERPQERVTGASLLDRSDGLTSAGTILGTPDYMAPEQAEDSSQADIRADIYSLGCTFFFLLTGEAPFAGDSVTRTLQSHIDRKPPSLLSLRPDLSPEIVRIVERMMAKDPAARFQKPSEVATALASFTTGGQASLQQWEAITVNRPANRKELGETESDEPPTTIELVRRRHWGTLWNRTRYETRKFFRLPHRRAAAGVGVILLVIASTVGLMEWSHRAAQAERDRQTNSIRNTSKPDPAAVAALPSNAASRSPRVALFVAQRDFYPDDYYAMRRALESRDAQVTVVSSYRGSATPLGSQPGDGQDVPVDRKLADVKPGDFDAIVILPAGRPDFLKRGSDGATMGRLLKLQDDHGVCIAAIQNAVAVLAENGLLKGQRAAAQFWITQADWFDHGEAIWVPQSSVIVSGRDNRLFTANNFNDAEELADRMLKTIAKKAKR